MNTTDRLLQSARPMILDLALGGAVVAMTVLTHTLGLIALAVAMKRIISWFAWHQHGLGKIVAIVVTVFGLFGLHLVEIGIWAAAYLLVGALPDTETALYFSATTFSTLGYGDVVLPDRWRLFGSLEGVNGFLLIGWSTAYLVSASTRYGPFRTGEHF